VYLVLLLLLLLLLPELSLSLAAAKPCVNGIFLLKWIAAVREKNSSDQDWLDLSKKQRRGQPDEVFRAYDSAIQFLSLTVVVKEGITSFVVTRARRETSVWNGPGGLSDDAIPGWWS
jgi:hypothetical protein